MEPTMEGGIENCKLMLDEQRPVRRSGKATFAVSPYPVIFSTSRKDAGRKTHQLSIKFGQSWLAIVVEDKHSVDHDEQRKSIRACKSDIWRIYQT
jgi:hypothetical protein